MIFFKILGQPFLVLGSAERTYDLFEKQSQKYSDRAHFPMFIELLVASSPCYVRHAYQKIGWISNGTCLYFDTDRSGGATDAPSMIISIQTSSTSIIPFKSP